MDRESFDKNLAQAARSSHEKALLVVENELKPPFTFRVRLNQSYDGNPLAPGETVLAEMRSRGGAPISPLTHDEVVDLLWRCGLVPD